MVGIVYIRWLVDFSDVILKDLGARLVTKGVYASTIVHVFGKEANLIVVHFVVVHATDVGVPTPTERDGCIGNLFDRIVFDFDASHIASCNGMSAPVFGADVVYVVSADV